jgi:glycosyltransferase involved in cell wall biosynthesis
MKKSIVTILIPTYNNRLQIIPCLNSIQRTALGDGLVSVIVINNGEKRILDDIKGHNWLTILEPGKNLGWEGGLKLALEQVDSDFVMFLNDDTLIPDSSAGWIQRMLQHFVHPEVGAVGPITNVAMGQQNMGVTSPKMIYQTSFLIGFCILLRTSILREVGGIDDSLPGGDDLDLSIRLDDKGYILLVDRNVFIYHYGFQTGNRLHGDASQKGGWNNYLSTEQTNFGLIKKHGFKRWYECLSGVTHTKIKTAYELVPTDSEGDKIRTLIKGELIYEFGCGATKTVPQAIGFDLVPKGHHIDTISGAISIADEVIDVSKPFPERIKLCDCIVARHILEHCIDTVETLKNWKKVLKCEGKLIIAVPNNDLWDTIPVNIEHKHAFNPKNIKTLFETVGFKDINIYDSDNGVSFIAEGTNL